MGDLSKELTLDHIAEGPYRQIAEAIGTGNFYKLTVLLGGATVYIPKPESLLRPIRDAHIKLATQYGLTERWVRQLCGPGQTEGQMDLFDTLDADGNS